MKTIYSLFKSNKVLFIGTLFCILAVSGFVAIQMWPSAFSSNSIQGLFTDKVENSQESVKRLKEGSLGDVSTEKLFPENMEESNVQDAIHLMSHQKVEADEKWGSLQISDARIQRLIEVIEMNKNQYDHAYVYLDILNRWMEDDFSKADQDHNAIWRLQGGTIGEATGVLSQEEEEKYIKKNF
jgi:Family of unknown function (DUF6241)